MLVRLILGARYTILIGLGAAAAGLVLGITLGAVSGYSRGWIDLTIQRFIDIILAFPHFLLALALIAVFGPGIRNLMIALAVTSFPRTVRLIRASVLSVREQPYVEAARSMGVSERRILWRHIVPNASTPAVAQAPLELATAILTATGLGFLGLGVQSPIPEWGAMMGEGRDFMLTRPGLVTLPGVVYRRRHPGLQPAGRRDSRCLRSSSLRSWISKEAEVEGMTDALLRVRGLRTYFHTAQGVSRAVDGVDLTLAAGRILGIVGESGSGKSVTAMSIIRLVDVAGEIMPDSHVYFDGRDLVAVTENEMRAVRGGRYRDDIPGADDINGSCLHGGVSDIRGHPGSRGRD